MLTVKRIEQRPFLSYDLLYDPDDRIICRQVIQK
jgi:hypothetical protein